MKAALEQRQTEVNLLEVWLPTRRRPLPSNSIVTPLSGTISSEEMTFRMCCHMGLLRPLRDLKSLTDYVSANRCV